GGGHQGRLDRRARSPGGDRPPAGARGAVMQVAAGRVVTLEYTVRLASGGLVDSTGGCGPVAILVGGGQLFPALEERIGGMQAGETRELRIPADEAYGARRAEPVVPVPAERLPAESEL